MKYVQPYGITDPDAPYINGDPSIGRMGSIPPAAAFEHPLRELVGIISKNQLVPTDTDLLQAFKATRSQRGNYAQDTGSVNHLSVAFDPAFTNYTIGLPIRIKVANTNTGPVDINAGAGVVQVKKPNGAQLASGDITAGGLIDLCYDGTAFQMINFGQMTTIVQAPGDPVPPPVNQVYLVNIPYAVDIGSANNIVVNFSPAISSLVAGSICLVKIAATNTGPTVMNAQGFGNRPVVAGGGAPNRGGALIFGDLQAGAVHFMRYDGSQWWIDPSPTLNGNITLYCSNNQQVDDTFIDLSRKRIASNGSVAIQLNSGVYGPIDTYHVDADRITVQGTMLAALPNKNDFSKTGNLSNDNLNNIAMLRSRYGTEIRYGVGQEHGLRHHGPGRITIKNLLIVGASSASSDGSFGCVPDPGGWMLCQGVSIHGAQWNGFGSYAASLTLEGCFSVSGWRAGLAVEVAGAAHCTNCGFTGFSQVGVYVAEGSGVLFEAGNDASYNGNYGVVCAILGSANFNQAGQTVLGNPYADVFATNMSTANVGSTTVGSTSPARGTVGNSNSIIT